MFDILYLMKALQLAKPHVLVMIGGPASGKTTFAEKFADTFHAPYIDAKKLHLDGGDPASTLKLAYDIMAQIHKTKQTIVYEGLTGSRTERTQVAKLARDKGYEPLFVWVQTDSATAHARATRRSRINTDPMSDDDFERESKQFTPPSAQERAVVISGMHTYATQAKTVLKRLAETSNRKTDTTEASAQQRSPRRSVIIR